MKSTAGVSPLLWVVCGLACMPNGAVVWPEAHGRAGLLIATPAGATTLADAIIRGVGEPLEMGAIAEGATVRVAIYAAAAGTLKLPGACVGCLELKSVCPSCLSLPLPVESYQLDQEGERWSPADAEGERYLNELADKDGSGDCDSLEFVPYYAQLPYSGARAQTLVDDFEMLLVLENHALARAKFDPVSKKIEVSDEPQSAVAPESIIALTTGNDGRAWALDTHAGLWERTAPGVFSEVARPLSPTGTTALARAWLAVDPGGETFYAVTATATLYSPTNPFERELHYAALSYVPGEQQWVRHIPPDCSLLREPESQAYGASHIAWMARGQVASFGSCDPGLLIFQRGGDGAVSSRLERPDFVPLLERPRVLVSSPIGALMASGGGRVFKSEPPRGPFLELVRLGPGRTTEGLSSTGDLLQVIANDSLSTVLLDRRVCGASLPVTDVRDLLAGSRDVWAHAPGNVLSGSPPNVVYFERHDR